MDQNINEPTVLLIEHRLDYRAIYGMNLNLYLGAKVLVANTIKESVDLIKAHKISLVFLNNEAYTQDLGAELWKIIDRDRYDIPLFILGHAAVPQEHVTLFDKSIQLKDVLHSIAKKLGVTAKQMVEKRYPAYFPLAMEFLIPGWQTTIPIFELKGSHYQEVFAENEIILGNTLEELRNKEHYQLYVQRDERLKFVNSLTTQISAKINDPNLSIEERMEVTATGFQMVMEQARVIGVSQSTLDLANSCINSMSTVIESIPNLDSLLNNLLNVPESYRYKQSLLIAYIGSHIIKKIPWGNTEQQNKFTFVAFFHNIALTKDEYAKVTSDSELEESELNEKEKELISKHALLSAKLLANVDSRIPFEAPTIIKQHHGSKKGIGLSKLSMNISPLAMIFLFAEEWANIVLKYENETERPNKQKIISMLHRKYNQSGFNKILPILHTLDL